MIRVLEPQLTIPKKSFTPIGRMLAVHAYPPSETPSGLIMPDGVANPMQTGLALVIAAGPDCKQVKEGDVVLYTHQMSAVIHDGNTVGLLHEDNVAGVVLK